MAHDLSADVLHCCIDSHCRGTCLAMTCALACRLTRKMMAVFPCLRRRQRFTLRIEPPIHWTALRKSRHPLDSHRSYLLRHGGSPLHLNRKPVVRCRLPYSIYWSHTKDRTALTKLTPSSNTSLSSITISATFAAPTCSGSQVGRPILIAHTPPFSWKGNESLRHIHRIGTVGDCEGDVTCIANEAFF